VFEPASVLRERHGYLADVVISLTSVVTLEDSIVAIQK
jgi:hypothetical protein